MKSELYFIEVIDRAKKALKINTDKELAKALGMSSSAFNNRKKAHSLPYDELIELFYSRNMDFNLLLRGKEIRSSEPEEDSLEDRINEIANIFEEFDEIQQKEIYAEFKAKKRIKDLAKAVEGLQKIVCEMQVEMGVKK